MKLYHDNARAHHARDVTEFLQQQQRVIRMPHPSYPPDLAPSDFWLFSHLKRQLSTYPDAEALREDVTKVLHNIPLNEFRRTFNKWIERMELCVANQGNYFEHLVK